MVNGYAEIKKGQKGELVSTKEEKGHGYGVGNIKQCVEKNKGTYRYRTEDGFFVTEIVLPDVVSDENKE